MYTLESKGRRDSRSREFRERDGLKIRITDTRERYGTRKIHITDRYGPPFRDLGVRYGPLKSRFTPFWTVMNVMNR